MKDVVIIPTYNEKKNIRELVRNISLALPSVHILVVDDNSPDGTANEVKEAKKEIPKLELLFRSKKEGLRKAYVAAFKKVLDDKNVRYLCTMDADFSHKAQYLSEIFRALDKFDVVVGSRYLKGGGMNNWPLWHRALSQVANLYCRTTLRLPVTDYTSGFIGIRASLFRKIDLEKISAIGFTFLIELKYLLWEQGGRFKETPVVLENRAEGESKITLGIILEGLLTSWRLIFRKYTRKLK